MPISLLESSLKQASVTQIDACWAILKYKDMGILRKVRCISFVLDIDYDTFLKECPSSNEGRIYDQHTRNMIDASLKKYS